MISMIDIYDTHNHLLPGVDDGPSELIESIKICEIAGNQNTKSIIVTPHRKDVTENLSVHAIKHLTSEINQILRLSGVEVEIKLGMENHIDLDLIRDIEDGKALTLNNSRYILVEMPWEGRPPYLEEIISNLLRIGLIPVLAHPERMSIFENERNFLFELVKLGCKSQITAGSLYGKFGSKAQKNSISMMTQELVHIVASDTHMADGKRSYDLDKGLIRAEEIVGKDTAVKMLSVNPLAILENRTM